MNENKLSLAFAVAICLAATFNARASAAIVLDQMADAFNAPNPTGELGGPSIANFQSALQTFTVGVGGVLARIDVQVQHGKADLNFHNPGEVPNADLTLSLLGTNGGMPDRAQDLGSVSLPLTNIPPFDRFTSGPFTAFDVSGLGIAVAPGDRLA
ncbi:MAG: hypothetical protein AAGD07_01565 [Planctomycetota bacterium]